MGDIGNRDPKDMTAGVLGVLIGMRVTGVVMIARVRGVDRYEGQVAQVLAAFQPGGLGAVGLCDHLVGEGFGNAVLMDRDQGHGLRRRGVAQPVDDARLG